MELPFPAQADFVWHCPGMEPGRSSWPRRRVWAVWSPPAKAGRPWSRSPWNRGP